MYPILFIWYFLCAAFSDIFHNTVCHCHTLYMRGIHTKPFFLYNVKNILMLLFNERSPRKRTRERQKKQRLNKRSESVIVFMFTEFTLWIPFLCQYFFFLFTGRPQPQVRWLVNGVLVDDQYEHNTGDVIENRLLWPAVQRSDLNAIFTCQAVNTILVEPKENSYVLDLHRKYSLWPQDNNHLFFMIYISFSHIHFHLEIDFEEILSNFVPQSKF